MKSLAAKKKQILNKGKSQVNVASDDVFQNNVVQFNSLSGKVKAVDECLRKYQKSVTKLQPTLEKLAQALCEFYTEEDYEQYGKEFEKSTQVVHQAIQGFQVEVSSIGEQIEDYLSKISTTKKNLSEREKLYNNYKSKEKESQKTTGKKEVMVAEKFQAAKDSYDVKHEEVARELGDLLANKNSDFEGKFFAIVEAQVHLFSKMSNSFEMPALEYSSAPAPQIVVEGQMDPPSRPTSRPKIQSRTPSKDNRAGDPPKSPAPSNADAPARSAPIPPPYEAPTVGSLGPAPLPPSEAPLPPAPLPYPAPTIRKLSIVPEGERNMYVDIFRREEKGLGHLGGQTAFLLFSQSNLSPTDLALIWELADQDKDGNLIEEEFVLAMHLINTKLRNPTLAIPLQLPPEMKIHPL